jgi:hypothetical protein
MESHIDKSMLFRYRIEWKSADGTQLCDQEETELAMLYHIIKRDKASDRMNGCIRFGSVVKNERTRPAFCPAIR